MITTTTDEIEEGNVSVAKVIAADRKKTLGPLGTIKREAQMRTRTAAAKNYNRREFRTSLK